MSEELIKHQSVPPGCPPEGAPDSLPSPVSLRSARIPFSLPTFASLHLWFSTFNVDWNKSLLNCSETWRKELEAERVINAKPDWSVVSLFQSPRSIHFRACCCVLGMRGASTIHGLIFIVFANCFSHNSTRSALIYSSQMNRQYKMGSVTSCEGTSFSRINMCPSHSKFRPQSLAVRQSPTPRFEHQWPLLFPSLGHQGPQLRPISYSLTG